MSMKVELHIELFRACCHPQRVLCPLPVPGPNLRCCLGQSRMDSLGTAGCHWGLWSDWSSGRDWGKFLEVFRNFQFCFATLAPSWLELWQLPQSCSSFPMRKRPQVQFQCVPMTEFIVSQAMCELLFGSSSFRTVTELPSGKCFVWTQTWESLDFPFGLGWKWLHLPVFNLLFLE